MKWQEVETFLALSRELHFARTAERLRLSPARVTQLIQKLERHVGAPLFARSSREVALTEAGVRLRDDIAPAYAAIQDGFKRAAEAGREISGELRLGFLGPATGRTLVEITDAFTERHAGANARPVMENNIRDQLAPLRDGDIDVLAAQLPVRESDLVVGPVILREPLIAAVPAGHPLAERGEASLEDLADYPVIAASATGYWADYYLPPRTPSGRAIKPVMVVDSILAGLAMLRAGKGISVVVEQVTEYYQGPDIAYVPLVDGPVCEVALVWRADRETELVRAFARTAASFTLAERGLSKSPLSRSRFRSDDGPGARNPAAAGRRAHPHVDRAELIRSTR